MSNDDDYVVRLLGGIRFRREGKSFSFQVNGMALLVILALIVAATAVLLATPIVNLNN